MDSAILGLVPDSSIIIDAERQGWTVTDLLESIRQDFGELDVAIFAVTITELVHGICRANTPERSRHRRGFVEEVKKHVPVHPLTTETAELIGELSARQAASGTKIPFDDLAIAASALEQQYAVATLNLCHFSRALELIVKTR